MAAKGPAPARSSERRRRNEPEHPVVKMGPDELAALPFPIDLAPTPPDPDEVGDVDDRDWHPYVRYLWEKLQVDPSRKWNGPAAMAVDLAMCENLSRLLNPRVAGIIPASEYGPGEMRYERLPMNGAEITAVMKWASARGLYEADRLRIGKEIEFYSQTGADGAPATGTDGGGQVISMERNRRAALGYDKAAE